MSAVHDEAPCVDSGKKREKANLQRMICDVDRP